MKFLIFAACLLPAVMAAPKRGLLDPIFNGNPFDLSILKCDMQIMLDQIGSDPSEATCELECHKLLQDGHILNYGCPLVCHGFQNIANYFHIAPQPTDGTDPCAALTTTVSA